jgi:hypothetical protein
MIASFIIGVLMGAAALNLVSGTHLEKAQLEIERLNAQLAEQSEQITALEETIAQHEHLAVTEIEVHVSFKDPKQDDELHTLGIERTIKELLKTVRGREVSTLDPVLILNIVDGRSIAISNVEFTVTVKSLLVSDKLILHVEAVEKTQPVNNKKKQLSSKELNLAITEKRRQACRLRLASLV